MKLHVSLHPIVLVAACGIVAVSLAFGAGTPSARAKTGEEPDSRTHWAYQPVTKPAEPTVQHPAWIKTSVDSFILAKLEAAGMKPSVAAARETLLRRVTFDLIGLPPTTDELRAFLADTSPNAFAAVV